jgi:outer membrane protein OmpA-like peptidoglycan-associated protein
MRKNRFFAIVLGVLLTVSGYSQTGRNEAEYPKAGFFFGAGVSSGIFTSDKLAVYSDYDITRLNPAKIGAYYELPLGIGNFFAGLEGGFASKSLFGGGGQVDFLPINLNATFAFGIADLIYVGPSLKAGVLGLLGHEEYNFLPLLGAALDLELRYRYFPLSVYGQAGVNLYPTASGINALPTVEAGVRIPRGAFGSSGQTAQSTRSGGTSAGTGGAGAGTGGGTGSSLTGGTDTVTGGTPPPPPPPPPVPPPFPLTPTAPSRIITLEAGRQGLFSSVYFEPDTGVLIERYRPVLEEAGQLLAANPQLQLTLRTYTALFGTYDGRYMVSMERGQFCRDYFIENYGIAPSRITIEPYGSEREPLSARTDDWVSYRCAELIITE